MCVVDVKGHVSCQTLQYFISRSSINDTDATLTGCVMLSSSTIMNTITPGQMWQKWLRFNLILIWTIYNRIFKCLFERLKQNQLRSAAVNGLMWLIVVIDSLSRSFFFNSTRFAAGISAQCFRRAAAFSDLTVSRQMCLPPGLFLLPLRQRQSANTRGSIRLLATISLHQQHWAVCGFFHEPCATSYQCVTITASESQPKERKEQKHQHLHSLYSCWRVFSVLFVCIYLHYLLNGCFFSL